MTYKYKDDIKRVLFEQQRVEQNPSVLNTAFNMRDELNEVYEAADKVDEIKAAMELPETTYGETFTKLAKIKEIVEGME